MMHNYDAFPSIPAVGLQRGIDLCRDDAAFCQITLTSCLIGLVLVWSRFPVFVKKDVMVLHCFQDITICLVCTNLHGHSMSVVTAM